MRLTRADVELQFTVLAGHAGVHLVQAIKIRNREQRHSHDWFTHDMAVWRCAHTFRAIYRSAVTLGVSDAVIAVGRDVCKDIAHKPVLRIEPIAA